MALTLPVATHERLEHLQRLPGSHIRAIAPDSLAEEAGLRVGDRVLMVNNRPVKDIVDWKFHVSGEEAIIRYARGEGEVGELDQFDIAIHKGYDEDLGISFEDDLFDRLHICKNKCVFCFLYQQPKGLRPSLYIKDDDFRLSFLHGNYVTLTNLKEGELDRICEQKLSPLYVSIHATDPVARGQILGRKTPEPILPILERLIDSKIQIHGQVVLCPGYNDGDVLAQTIEDLSKMHPDARETYGGIVSLAVVPIGITQFRERLAPVTTVSPSYAGELLEWIEPRRQQFLKKLGTRFVYFSDEFYLSSGKAIPPRNHYEGFPQLEDGVGLVRLFLDEMEKLVKTLPKSVPTPRSYTIVTGEVAGPLLNQFANVMNTIDGLTVNVCAVHNWFFAGNINIAGLIVGKDIIRALADFPVNDTVMLPSVMLRDGEEVFLDEMTLTELRTALGRPVVVVERTPTAAAQKMLE
jgi:putative radical SAM enzyme (TIGR03279 family)